MNVFAQIRKVDEAKRLVFGRAAEEVVDHSGEIMDYLSTKPHFQKWSADVSADSDGKSLGNLRAMHGKVAAGKLTDIVFDDEAKAIDVVAKVVDDAEWKKVLEGVYTGFSIGGSYVGAATVEKINGEDVKRYTAKPNELSLVDRPCIPTAKFFEVQKADGTSAEVPFREPAAEAEDSVINGTPEQVEQLCKVMNDGGLSLADVIGQVEKAVAERKDTSAKAGTSQYGDVKFADATNKKYPIDTPEHIRAAWNYINKAKNAAKYSDKDVAAIKAHIVAAWKSKIDKEGPPAAEKLEKLDDVTRAALRKSMYSCQSMAGLIGSLQSMMECEEWEAYKEGDTSTVPTRIGAVIALAGQVLKEMIDEELKEIAAGDALDTDEMMEMAERAGALAKLDEAALPQLVKLMPAYAVAVREALGIAPAAEAAPADDLQKLLDERLAPLTKQLTEAQAEIKRISEQPAPARVSLRAVSKQADVVAEHHVVSAEVKKVADSKGVVNETATLIKAMHQQGGQPITLRLSK
jgi:hypothetical protein